MHWRFDDAPLFDDLPLTADRSAVLARVACAVLARWPDAWTDVVVDGPTGVRGLRPGPARERERPGWVPDAPECAAAIACFADGAPRRIDATEVTPGARGQLVVLPVASATEVRASLRVARPGPFLEEEHLDLTLLAQAAAGRLRERQAVLEARVIAALSELPSVADGSEAVAAGALRHLTAATGASSGAVFVERGGRLWPLSDVGVGANARRDALAEGIPRRTGFAWRALLENRALFVSPYRESGAALPDLAIDPHVSLTPLGRRDAPRWVLVLAFPEDAPPFAGDLTLVRTVAPALATALERAATIEAEERMVSLQERLPDLPTQALHPLLLESAVNSVPGADAGALLVRDGRPGGFRFRATRGYDSGALDELTVNEADAVTWYDPERAEWGDGAPRVLRPDGLRYLRMARKIGLGRDAGMDPELERVRADLTVPVRDADGVDALLVLHSATRDTAFGRDSVRVARQWSLAARALLRVARDRDRFRREAVTDGLTGLLNRRGAEMELERALARAERADQPLSVASIDLGSFKAINDAYGHAAGDRALVAAADALLGAVRAGDVVARWGGDEFLVLLPQQSERDADRTARRLAEALATVRESGRPLVAHVGTASFPTDALAGDELLRLADRRMYHHKRAGCGDTPSRSAGAGA